MRVDRARGILAAFNAAEVLEAADVHVARRLGELARESDESVLLAVALTVRAARLGAVCLDLRRLREVAVEQQDPASLPWPDAAGLLEALRRSPLVTGGVSGTLTPLHLVDDGDAPLLYLDRYHRQEQLVRHALLDRALTRPAYDVPILRAGLDRHFGPPPDRQRLAAALAVTRWTSIVAGGPGTGKTFTVARLLTLLSQQPGTGRVALAAPTGKAAARLQEQVNQAGLPHPATTLHRLLGWRPDSATRFRHDARHRLPYDVVVLDETSMVSLTMMARLFEALQPDTRLVLVGDPDQLASVDAGAVLADLIARPAPAQPDPELVQLVADDLDCGDGQERGLSDQERRQLGNGVVRLTRGRRFGGAIAHLAAAVRDGHAERALELLEQGDQAVSLVAADRLEGLREDVVAAASDIVTASLAGNVAAALSGLSEHRLLCAHRQGPAGVAYWDEVLRGWLLSAHVLPHVGRGRFAVGQPLLVTANDHEAKVYNGDTGVVVAVDAGQAVAAFARAGGPLLRNPATLRSVQAVQALTIHRSQGSQYRSVTVLLPPTGSALLTRELLYTALTRAQERVRLVGTADAVRDAVGRRVLRASGLRRVSLD